MVKTNIKATNISFTPSRNEYIEKKMAMLDKFFHGNEDVLASIEVGKSNKHHKSGDIFRAEIHITTNGDSFYVTADKEDLYAAIDEVKDQMARELTSKRKKTLRLFRRGGAKIKDILKGVADFRDRSWKRFRGGK